jgi:hypothetical protein
MDYFMISFCGIANIRIRSDRAEKKQYKNPSRVIWNDKLNANQKIGKMLDIEKKPYRSR